MILIVVGRRGSVARPLWMAVAAALCVLGLENKVQAILLIGGTATPDPAVRKRSKRKRRVLAQRAVALAGRGRCGDRGVRRGMGGMAAGCDRLRPRPARRRAVPSAVARPVRHLSGGAIGPDRRLHDRLCRDLARQRGRDAGIDVGDCRRRLDHAAPARPRLRHAQRDCRVQSAGKNADLRRHRDIGRRERIKSGGHGVAAARRGRLGSRALHFRAALLAASDGVPDLADHPRYRLCVATRRKAGRDPGAGATSGRDRDRRARRAARAEIRIFHLHRSADHPLRRDPARQLGRSALAAMDLPVAMVLFGLHIAVGQAEPVKYAFMRRGPESICEWNGYYMPLLPLPWCKSPPMRP